MHTASADPLVRIGALVLRDQSMAVGRRQVIRGALINSTGWVDGNVLHVKPKWPFLRREMRDWPDRYVACIQQAAVYVLGDDAEVVLEVE